ncbi:MULTISPECIES: hypothetical protein [unclassified Burkholderia]|uniref:hypothetical protein n=1 Tax=unclassified Burkholderia TaxID=2613784 RepID=UPI0015C5B1EE|nr:MULTISPECIES: hypothetical protein [unclassified Burkholderia]MDN7429353.1 hypothetical protein [Burkholderia sp. AU45388]
MRWMRFALNGTCPAAMPSLRHAPHRAMPMTGRIGDDPADFLDGGRAIGLD